MNRKWWLYPLVAATVLIASPAIAERRDPTFGGGAIASRQQRVLERLAASYDLSVAVAQQNVNTLTAAGAPQDTIDKAQATLDAVTTRAAEAHTACGC